MNKIDFINWLLNRFNVPDIAFESELNKYSNGLIENIDFDKLKTHVEKHCKSKPMITELNRIVKTNGFEREQNYYPKCNALLHAMEIKKIPHVEMNDFSDELKEKMINTLNKYGIKPGFIK